jgi:hypothetical protein
MSENTLKLLPGRHSQYVRPTPKPGRPSTLNDSSHKALGFYELNVQRDGDTFAHHDPACFERQVPAEVRSIATKNTSRDAMS